MSRFLPSHPILDCAAAGAQEAAVLGADDERAWAAMQQAGRAVGQAVREDFGELGMLPADARVLVLIGQGHNGGDALIAARELAGRASRARFDLAWVAPPETLRPLAARAWREFEQATRGRARNVTVDALAPGYDVALDGVHGFNFRPPLRDAARAWLRAANAVAVRLRAAIDLPSGLHEADAFRADFTYATGIVKSPVVDLENAGRVRYLDLGFFGGGEAGAERVLTSAVLAPLRSLRAPRSDKRSYGQVVVLGGSRMFAGAILMSVMAALRAGAGLVSALVPESVAAAFAARVPEAMWQGCPETPEGGLTLEAGSLLRRRIERADALLIGPGLGREAETLAMVRDVVEWAEVPLVLDADALQPEIVRAGRVPRIVTPHAGEFARIAGGAELAAFKVGPPLVTVLKGPVTRVRAAGAGEPVYHALAGGPVLARGGSGDQLAGLMATLLAQQPDAPLRAAAQAVVWQGAAAEALARAHGQVAVTTTQWLDYLPVALRV